MSLSERQLTAQSLASEINSLGAWCVSPMPLDDNARLRFQVLDSDRDKVLEKLSSWNWSPILVSTLPRVCNNGWHLASVYEIDLPRARQFVYDGRIHRDIADKEKKQAEVDILKYLGWKK